MLSLLDHRRLVKVRFHRDERSNLKRAQISMRLVQLTVPVEPLRYAQQFLIDDAEQEHPEM